MMHAITEKPATTPIPVQLSAPEFTQFLLPHLSMPKRGPQCKLGYHCVFNLILGVLYTCGAQKFSPHASGRYSIHLRQSVRRYTASSCRGTHWL